MYGIEIDLGSPVASVNFTDGSQPEAARQAGVIDFKENKITWCNNTVFKRK